MKILSENEALALAQEAFRRFHAQCFWFMRPDLQIDRRNLPLVIKGLREHGNRETYQIAALLCR
ncbi:MAG: hypothetical protein PHV34_12040 [Verrucomicrobiae bacterium]|nr:hypothetical protein [Verrucomicrobiae bacterium]